MLYRIDRKPDWYVFLNINETYQLIQQSIHTQQKYPFPHLSSIQTIDHFSLGLFSKVCLQILRLSLRQMTGVEFNFSLWMSLSLLRISRMCSSIFWQSIGLASKRWDYWLYIIFSTFPKYPLRMKLISPCFYNYNLKPAAFSLNEIISSYSSFTLDYYFTRSITSLGLDWKIVNCRTCPSIFKFFILILNNFYYSGSLPLVWKVLIKVGNRILFNFIMAGGRSQLEKRFIASSLYKRSRHYLDINRLNQIEVREQQQRRKPFLDNKSQNFDKFEESFVSAKTKLNLRLQTEFDKHQKRFFHDDNDDTETNYTFEGRKGKTLDMSKMLSRDYFEKDSRQCKNESHFCNFKHYTIPSNNVDFNKFYVPKQSRKRQPSLACQRCKSKIKPNHETKTEQLNSSNTSKIRERLIFDESLFKSKVDYKKYDKQKTERDEEVTPQKKYDRIIVGENMTRKKINGVQVEFYHGTHKWNSSQMDSRLLKPNEYFIKAYNRKNEDKMDWSIAKKKTDLIERRKQQIVKRKNIEDVKGEICDMLFFRRNS